MTTNDDTGETEYASPREPSSTTARDIQEVDIKPTANGGFTAEFRFKQKNNMKGPSQYMEPDMYAFSSFAELADHLRTVFGEAEAPVEGNEAVAA